MNDLGNITFQQKFYDASLEYYDECIKSFPEFEINKTFNRLLLINSYYYWASSIVELLMKTYVLREEVLKGIQYLEKAEKIIINFDIENPRVIPEYLSENHYRHEVSLKDINKLLVSGADKVTINTAAVNSQNLIKESSKKFGSQCIVVAIDAKKKINGKFTHMVEEQKQVLMF